MDTGSIILVLATLGAIGIFTVIVVLVSRRKEK